MTGVAARPRRQWQRWVSVAALVLCVGYSVADTHVHVGEVEEDGCAVCAIFEPGRVAEVALLDARPSAWRRYSELLVSVTVSARPYEVPHPRAPPIS